MSNIISHLYRGEFNPKSVLGIGNGEMRKAELLIEKNFSKLNEFLTKDEKDVLEKYKYCIEEYITLITEQAFCDSFCAGMRILSESVGGAERIL